MLEKKLNKLEKKLNKLEKELNDLSVKVGDLVGENERLKISLKTFYEYGATRDKLKGDGGNHAG